MKLDLAQLRALLAGDRQADRVVPPSGYTAQLTLFAAGAMAFLAVFALALSLAAGRLAERWGAELAHTATLRIVAPADQRAEQTAAALAVLETTPGVAEARALTDAEQAALLAPWFGADLPLDTLPVPRLIETKTESGFDPTGLSLRLAAEVPGAVLDDHGRWRAPLVSAASRLRVLGWVVALLIVAAVAAMVTLAANAALAANAQVIAVLRLVGATDSYIANAFVRRFTLRALSGSAVGVIVGLLAVWLMPTGSADAPGLLTGIGFRGAGWLVPLMVPLVAGLVALLATNTAARRALGGLT
ncbi:FtsX-like permease family protein [uncultured Tateyamaria sp.]|uniref:cell division protein FtsX n=1 Tax=Tateyamaria sp. 1078 TaxID=3417464 RepID=UPI00260EDBB4|nr:FtsX-like permease family protein [uncultured Tateyamaria sp.]